MRSSRSARTVRPAIGDIRVRKTWRRPGDARNDEPAAAQVGNVTMARCASPRLRPWGNQNEKFCVASSHFAYLPGGDPGAGGDDGSSEIEDRVVLSAAHHQNEWRNHRDDRLGETS